ncbi:hypothetical protein EZL74_03940 [Flavobacterium silvisoli]|uniref:Uncharacterized protein n=1 Tax=Flavobacterium silvisoli TaxID=2529433 RepID=A0A4Q9Z1U1_9FLAO|nr:hypothetical protein [Flavobacterium silvisoli]TBX70335.1 hypothetical protein EZL74_03940 [Flavobacterium silvisoli]
MKKTINFILALFIVSVTQKITAQKIELKNNTVVMEDKPIFSFDKKAMNNEFHLFKLNSKEEVLILQHQHVGADTGAKDDFKKIIFPSQNITIESRVLQKKNWKFLVQLLLDEKVIDTDGNIDVRNLERFSGKYNEKITLKK